MIQLSPRDGLALQRDNRKADALGSIFQLFSGPSHLYWVLQSKPMTKTLPLPYPTSSLSGPLLKKPRYPLLFLELIDFTHNSLTRCLSACLLLMTSLHADCSLAQQMLLRASIQSASAAVFGSKLQPFKYMVFLLSFPTFVYLPSDILRIWVWVNREHAVYVRSKEFTVGVRNIISK